MSSTPIPLTPVFFCLVGAAAAGGSLWFRISVPEAEPIGTLYLEQDVLEEREVAALKYHDTPLAIEAGELIVKRSGFDPGRSEYSRTVRRAAPVEKAPEFNPQYVGSLGRGAQARVMIQWEASGQPQTHSIGDETPWGVLKAISSTQLVFDHSDGERSLDLF